LHTAKQWFLRTPERSLTQAYNAAQKIKSIEDEHFNGNKISTDLTKTSNNVMSYLIADIDKQLNIVKMRLTKFKASRSVIGGSNSAYLEKLRFIDNVLERYADKSYTSSPLVQLDKPIENEIKKQRLGQIHLL